MARTKIRDLALGVLRNIADGSIVSADISAGAIDSAGLIADNVITTAKILDGSISSTKIAAGAIDSAGLIANDAITDAKLATGISASKLTGALPAISGAALTGLSSYPGPSGYAMFDSNTTWTVPAGISQAKVHLIGGGGAGASSTTAAYNAGAGGGGGGYALRYVTGLTAGDNITITVGAGGQTPTWAASGDTSDGDSGGNTIFGDSAGQSWYFYATGGGGGKLSTGAAATLVSGAVGVGGTGVGGDLNLLGGNGGTAGGGPGAGSGGGGGGSGTGAMNGINIVSHTSGTNADITGGGWGNTSPYNTNVDNFFNPGNETYKYFLQNQYNMYPRFSLSNWGEIWYKTMSGTYPDSDYNPKHTLAAPPNLNNSLNPYRPDAAGPGTGGGGGRNAYGSPNTFDGGYGKKGLVIIEY